MSKQPENFVNRINRVINPMAKFLRFALIYIIIGIILVFGFTTFFFIGLVALGILVIAVLIFSLIVLWRMRGIKKVLKERNAERNRDDKPKMKNVTNQK